MATLAELQINVDSTQAKTGAETLTLLAEASAKVTTAFRNQKAAADALNSGGSGGGPGGGGGGGGGGGTKPINDLSSAIDNQTKKLKALEEQRKSLNSSDLKTTNPAEYQRLNQIIDTNITLVNRQGNALDRLANQAVREQNAKEAAANADKARLEAQARSVQSNEALAARAAVRAQRELDSTLNGLSAQIKAQQEYNRTIDQLNRARAVGGMNGPGNASLSSAEYDSYVKLAAAKRDEALATKDQSRELDQVRSKIDSVTATLGRAERAEVQYLRALTVLNDGLRLGALTADQYNTKLGQITTRRDQAIASTNSNTAAEARYARELFNVMSAYDPLLRAQQSYNEGVKTLSTALQSGKLSVDQFNKALGDQRAALDQVKAAQPNSEQSQSARYQQALDRLLPYNAQLRALADAEKILQQQQASGKVVTDQQIAGHKAATEAIAAERKEIERRTDASRKSGNSAKQDAQALRQVPAQITDIVVSLQGGQAPLTVLLQQGGQLKDVFGGVGPALKGLATGLLNLLTPTVLISSALFGLGIAAQAGSKELIAFKQATILTNGIAGVSVSEFARLRDGIDDIVGTSAKASEALNLMTASGKISGEIFEQVARAAISFERATGTALKDIIADFSSLGKDPVNAAVALDEKYKFLTSSVLAQADALVRSGHEFEATTLLQTELANATQEAAGRMVDQLNIVGRTIRGLKDGVSEVIDEFLKLGRVDTTADRLQELYRQRDNAQSPNKARALLGLGESETTTKKVADIDKEISQLKLRIQYEDYSAAQEKEREQNRLLSVASSSRLESNRAQYLDGVARAQEALNAVERDAVRIKQGAAYANREVTAEEQKLIDVNRSGAQRKLDEAKKQANKPKPAAALDTTNVQEVKNNLALVTSEYESYYKRVTSLGAAGVVSEEATYYSQKAILEKQKEAVSDSYGAQIKAIEELQARKGNSTSQTISLENQLSKAQTARVTAEEALDTRLEQLQNKESGRLETRKRNISAYKASLDQQVENLVNAGARNADGVGQGSRQAGVNREIGDNDRSFAKAKRQLADSLAETGDSVEYDAKLKDLEKTHNSLTAQIIQNDKDIQAANYDWTNGFTAAIQDAQDVGMNFAGSLQTALTGTFESAGDALATFVTTGVFNFRTFTTSILADMAKIAARQAASGALSGILSIAGAAANAYLGGGANGFAAGSAGATSSAAGASSAGYGNNYYQAKGGAWSGGTQMFANGGAFTNSIVSSPTSFGMSNGARGVMGEAGDEAIVPLARTRNGDLGIRALGGSGGGSGATIVNVNVQVTGSGSNSSSDGQPAWKKFGNDLGVFVRGEVYTIINTESRPGGQLSGSK